MPLEDGASLVGQNQTGVVEHGPRSRRRGEKRHIGDPLSRDDILGQEGSHRHRGGAVCVRFEFAIDRERDKDFGVDQQAQKRLPARRIFDGRDEGELDLVLWVEHRQNVSSGRWNHMWRQVRSRFAN